MSDSIQHYPFSAAPTLLGYLFQCRYALLASLQRLCTGTQFLISLETLDDIVFEKQGEPMELLQTKHHVSRAADLTDTSPDLWRTINVWCEALSASGLPQGSVFFLVTTTTAARGSAASYLRMVECGRDPNKAIERLNATADSSTNQANQAAYAAYRSLSPEQKSTLFGSVFVLDAVPQITDLDFELRKSLFFAADQRFLAPFLQRLEGWWFRRAVQHLSDRSAQPILSEEVEDEVADLREQFKADNLPIDDDIIAASVDASGYQDKAFVQQLADIQVSNPRILIAIKNYWRAFEQRSRWIGDDLLMVGELGRYEDRLTEEWQIRFEQMRDELGDEGSEEAKRQAAKALYKWVESGDLPPIRRGCAEPFVARGTYQILADKPRVGWHPDFLERLQHLLEPTGASR
jgi:hypothetical protein